jgi:predicted nucleic acid-binding protein
MKLVLDTNLVIGFFREPDRRTAFESKTRSSLLFMSSVVAMELQAGCRTTRQKRSLSGFLRPYEKTGRVIIPDYATFLETGRVMARMAADGIGRDHLRQIMSDILIAVSSSRAGALVVTGNSKDFSRIGDHTPIRWISPE